ncbi:uncharacterized protein ACOB8E_017407 isoform 1-T1 [Sarcophilus harrisii]
MLISPLAPEPTFFGETADFLWLASVFPSYNIRKRKPTISCKAETRQQAALNLSASPAPQTATASRQTQRKREREGSGEPPETDRPPTTGISSLPQASPTTGRHRGNQNYPFCIP